MTTTFLFTKISRLLAASHVFHRSSKRSLLSLLSSSSLQPSISTSANNFQVSKLATSPGLTRSIGTTAQVQQISSSPSLRKCRKMPKYTTVETGAPNSTSYSIYFRNEDGLPVSPLHDIPLFADEAKGTFNMVVEVPRWTNAKMEISLNTPLNPIKQDVKKGKLRYVANCFPHKGYIWNYGAFPQTWENPDHIEPSTGCKGDNDPIDVLEIGYRVAKRGEVVQVKVLGTIALIDEGETDWKIIAINVNDPLAEKMNDIGDVDKFFPGLLRATVEWFKIYKIPDGKPENQFAFNGDAKNAAFATNIIAETNKFWNGLINKALDGGSISCANTTVNDSPFLVSQEDASKIIDEAPTGGDVEEIPDTVDKWHFIHLK